MISGCSLLDDRKITFFWFYFVLFVYWSCILGFWWIHSLVSEDFLKIFLWIFYVDNQVRQRRQIYLPLQHACLLFVFLTFMHWSGLLVWWWLGGLKTDILVLLPNLGRRHSVLQHCTPSLLRVFLMSRCWLLLTCLFCFLLILWMVAWLPSTYVNRNTHCLCLESLRKHVPNLADWIIFLYSKPEHKRKEN